MQAGESALKAPESDAVETMVQYPEVDDSSALKDLGLLVGALYGFIESQNRDDCEFIAVVASQMRDSTPWESYRGTFEEIRSNTTLIWHLCSVDLLDEDALNMAIVTRPKVTKVLDARKFLGSTDWSKVG